jgi:hypothetical protein
VTGWYVFGVVPSDAVPPRGAYLVERGALAAVAAEVPLEDFSGEALQAHLNDTVWLEEKVRTHENVLSSFVGVAPVVPLRFGAVYRDVDQIRALLAERADFFETALTRLRGHIELGVKAWFDPASVEQPTATDGRSYLERRQSELSLERAAAAAATGAHGRLSTFAVDCVINRPQSRQLTGRDAAMLLNAAYLVPLDDDRLVEEVARLADQHAALGVTYEVTGPWPPYNFAPAEERTA